jgi:hypothetical protein
MSWKGPPVSRQLHQGPDGPYWVRPAYRREDYVVHSTAIKSIESERGGYLNVFDLMGERDGPFVGWEEIKRFESDGRRWVRLRQTSVDWCVDVEVLESGLGEVVPVDPLISYHLALEADRKLPCPVIYE